MSINPLNVGGSGDYGFFSISQAPEAAVEPDIDEKFYDQFAFDEKETLLGCKSLIYINCANTNHLSCT